MSSIVTSKVQQENQESLDIISTEALSNPLKGMTDVIKNRLHKIVATLTSKPAGINPDQNNAIEDQFVDFQIAHKEARGNYSKSVSYTEIKNILVTVPVGFTGDLVGYCQVLQDMDKVMSDLSRDVVEATHNVVLKYIGKPETMSNITNSDFAKVKLHSNQIEKFKKDMNRYFSATNKNQTLPIGKLIKNLNQFNDLANQVKNNVIPFSQDTKARNKLHRSYTDLQKSLDLLLVRIEQKPEQYQLNKLNAERLANLVNSVAVEIELYSALVNYNSQLVICVRNLQEKILSNLE